MYAVIYLETVIYSKGPSSVTTSLKHCPILFVRQGMVLHPAPKTFWTSCVSTEVYPGGESNLFTQPSHNITE